MARVLKGGRLPAAPGEGEGRPAPVIDAPFDPRREAALILEEARHEADRLRAQAQAEGRERGLAAVSELLITTRAHATRVRQHAQEDLRVLAVRIAEKILGRELAQNPDAIVDLVAEALTHAGSPKEVLLRVHPDDLKALERGRPRLLERCARAQAVQLRADPQVGRGGCIVETELGTVDARLPVQLAAIERALLGRSEE